MKSENNIISFKDFAEVIDGMLKIMLNNMDVSAEDFDKLEHYRYMMHYASDMEVSYV